MILEFTIENILSFKNKTTFSMIADSKKGLDRNLIKIDNLNVLKTVAIYGANGAGKTNVFKALGYSTNLLKTPRNIDINTRIPFYPFALDNRIPSFFEIHFIKNNIKYIYGHTHNSHDFISEYLYYVPNERKSLIFKRSNINEFEFPQKDSSILNRLKNEVLHNESFLSFITNKNYSLTKDAYDFLTQDISIIENIDDLQTYSQKYLFENINNKQIKNYVINYLNDAGINVSDFDIHKISLPDNILSKLKNEAIFDISDMYTTYFTHIYKNTEFKLNIDFESLGTKMLFYLIPYISNCLNENGILVIDEIDKSLHPLLVKQIINNFNSSSKNSQLIFNTHNISLLDQNTLRRDQMWFVDKDSTTGISDLYSINRFHPRNDENIEKNYLLGRYGAIPDLD